MSMLNYILLIEIIYSLKYISGKGPLVLVVDILNCILVQSMEMVEDQVLISLVSNVKIRTC